MSFKTNTITDKFKRTYFRAESGHEFKRAQELMFKMGFKWIVGDARKVNDYANGSNPHYLYVDENNRIMHSPTFQSKGCVEGFTAISLYDLRRSSDEVVKIRKAKKKEQRRRKSVARIAAANGYVKNTTGEDPKGEVASVLFRDGTIRVMNGYNGPDYSVPYTLNPSMTVEYYKLVQPAVTMQDMVADIVATAGGKEVVKVDADGWIDWAGGRCPVPDGTRVDVRYRDGEVRKNLLANAASSGGRNASSAFWNNDGYNNDIVAYRVVPTLQVANLSSIGGLVGSLSVSAGTPCNGRFTVDSEGKATPDTNPKRQFGMSSIPLNLWSPLASAYGAVSLYNGSLKYGRGNYKATPVEASIYVAAAMRHLAAWAEGEEFDPADGCPNLGGVLANVAILLDARAGGTLIDDRQLPSGYLQERDALKEIVRKLQDVHAGKDPRHYTIADKKD